MVIKPPFGTGERAGVNKWAARFKGAANYYHDTGKVKRNARDDRA
jgi:hypothetical protein